MLLHRPAWTRIRVVALLVAVFLAALSAGPCELHAQPYDPAKLAGLHGGLIVQLGAGDVESATRLSRTGRYLIHVLDRDRSVVDAARTQLRTEGHYGLAWAETHRTTGRLPYAENTVNLIVARDYIVPGAELLRVLAPGGVVLAGKQLLAEAGLEADEDLAVSPLLGFRKPWPETMDSWSHPRHAADGNAVSQDTLVGPPQRVRWVAAATSEVEGMVTTGGRNFYGSALARDSFNGLRLWHRDLVKGDINAADFQLPRLPRDGARPVASDQLLLVVLRGKPAALNAMTGEVVVEFDSKTSPTYIVHDGRQLIAADADSVRAFDIQTGKQRWQFGSSEPRLLVADGQVVSFVQGNSRRGEAPEAVTLDASSGTVSWRRGDYPWLAGTTRTVLAKGHLAFEVSTLNDDDADNGVHVVSSANGEHRWSKNYPPGMNHARQARAMFLENDLWILHGGKVNTSDANKRERQPTQVSALNLFTGETRVTHPAGLTHCFPPVCTPNFLFAGELDLTNLKSGEVVANRITKANCSRENGWVPANGLIYTTPKHCTCWPMLRGFVAMAPAKSDVSADDPAARPVEELEFLLDSGVAVNPDAPPTGPHDWPLYRHDRWRGGSTTSPGPKSLGTLWSTPVASASSPAVESPPGPILHDWMENPVVKGPVSPPTIANGLAYVTRPDAHELVALEAATGAVRWRFTATGRLDTPPAIHRGLCLFGSAAGWVYALRADTGELVWRMRAAPTDERIVAYGQVESPWPVPGAVLVMDDIAYFAAGRQPLADGGILVFAVDPLTGRRHWVRRIDSVPQKGFYENSGLEFDPFDILHAEGDGLAMSRWVLSLDGQEVDVDKWNAFARLNTGTGEAWVPRGFWTYGARHQHRFGGEAPRRPLVVFRDDNVYSTLDATTKLFRRDFDLEQGEMFDSKWITGWNAVQTANSGGKPYRNYRIAEKAKWLHDPFAAPGTEPVEPKRGTQLHNEVFGLALSGDGRLFVVHKNGAMKVVQAADGKVLQSTQVPPPVWDGLALAGGRLYLATEAGELVCLGE